MKRFFFVALALFLFLFISLVLIFFNPQWLINERLAAWGIDRANVFQSWQWGGFHLEHQTLSWKKRRLTGKIESFCFELERPGLQIDACIDSFWWDLTIDFLNPLSHHKENSVILNSSRLKVSMADETPSVQEKNQEESGPIDLEVYWSYLWMDILPEVLIKFEDIQFIKSDIEYQTELKISHQQKHWSVDLPELELNLRPKNLELTLKNPLHYDGLTLDGMGLKGEINDDKIWVFNFQLASQGNKIEAMFRLPSLIDLNSPHFYRRLDGTWAKATLAEMAPYRKFLDDTQWNYLAQFKAESLIELQVMSQELELRYSVNFGLKDQQYLLRGQTKAPTPVTTPNFLKEFILGTQIELEIDKIKQELGHYLNLQGELLPAPLNSMDGRLSFRLTADHHQNDPNFDLVFLARAGLILLGQDQEIDFSVGGQIPFNLETQALGTISLGVDLNRMNILLPRIGTTSMPPQFIPDSRIQIEPSKTPPKTSESGPQIELELDLKTSIERPIELSTHLVDEPIRIALDFQVRESEIKKGLVQILPLSTTLFKRPILVKKVDILFESPKEPVMDSVVEFRLPQYLVRLHIQGPTSSPRTFFSSEPPLPLDDIHAVLLFGRPMSGLDEQSRSDANKSAQILSQGLLSLSTLYFFAGSPVESLGYNPDREEVSAQFGIGENNSLRISGQTTGERTVGIRRSLGSGWYIDTSVQQNQNTGSNTQAVLLERIIAY